MFAKIRHCAIRMDERDKSYRFYKSILGMRRFTSGGEPEDQRSNQTLGQISDGVIGLALNLRPPGYRSGLEHFGFEVADGETVVNRIKQYYPDILITRGLEGVSFVETRVHDPVGTHIDVAQTGAAKLRDGYKKQESWESPRHVHHIALRAIKPAQLAEFYQRVFELAVVKELSSEGTICLTDNKTYLLIRPCHNGYYRSMFQGLDHLGFKVEDLESVKHDMEELSRLFPESAPRKILVGKHGHFVQKDMEDCPLGQFATADPEGVLLDFVT